MDNPSRPKAVRATVTIIFSDGSSRITDFREPASLYSGAIGLSDVGEIPLVPGSVIFSGEAVEYTLRIRSGEKPDSVISIESPVQS